MKQTTLESTARAITGLDKGMLEQVAALVDVPPENWNAFVGDMRHVVRVLGSDRTFDAGWQDQRVPRGEVVKHLDDLIAALEALDVDESPAIAAAGILFAGEPTGSIADFFEYGYGGQHYLGEVLKKARQAREIAKTTKWLRGRGAPRGTRGHPVLDYFLHKLLRATLKHGARRATAFKDRVTGSARGPIIEVLHLVAPYFGERFLPRGEGSEAITLYAITRARRAAKIEPIIEGLP
jgi:hypothetical protein